MNTRLVALLALLSPVSVAHAVPSQATTAAARDRARTILSLMDARSLAHSDQARGALTRVTATARALLGTPISAIHELGRGSLQLALENGGAVTFVKKRNGNLFTRTTMGGTFPELQHAEIGDAGMAAFYSADGKISSKPRSALNYTRESGQPGSRRGRFYRADTGGVERWDRVEQPKHGGNATLTVTRLSTFPAPKPLP